MFVQRRHSLSVSGFFQGCVNFRRAQGGASQLGVRRRVVHLQRHRVRVAVLAQVGRRRSLRAALILSPTQLVAQLRLILLKTNVTKMRDSHREGTEKELAILWCGHPTIVVVLCVLQCAVPFDFCSP